MDDANNQVLEWRKLDAPIPPEVWESGYWLYGLRGQYHSKGGWSKYFPNHLNMTATGEWWAPVNADGSPRPWPVAKPQTPPLEWRRGKISHELWKSGYWQYGLQDTEPMDGYVRYHGPEEWNPSFTDALDWWAPVNDDGTPRPWPDAKPQTPEWRKISCATDLTGYWLCGGIGADPNYCPLRTGGGFHRTGSGEWWAPVNADGTPRSWPELEAGIKKKTGASPVTPQPAPRPGTVDVWPLVIEDMRRRDADGRRQYGTPLQAHNGRDALQDAYEEALDLAVYLRQEIAERDDLAREIEALRVENKGLRAHGAHLILALRRDKESEIFTAHALVYLRVARAVPADRDYWMRLARDSREHAREARKEERIPAS